MPQLQNDSDPVPVGRPQVVRLMGFSSVALPTLIMVSLAPGLLTGCSGSDALTFPTYSPERMAQDAMAEYDTNHDGFLDAKELERCPGLKGALASMDKDGDHRLSADEIAERIRYYQECQVALTLSECRVLLDGRPLQGATVTYVPEKFMGSSIKSATGVSNSRGEVGLIAEGEKMPGVQLGFFRVQVSKKNASGKETIPARYNQDTILGIEVSPRRKAHVAWTKGHSSDDAAGVFRLSSSSR